MTFAFYGLLGLTAAYAAFFAVVLAAMRRPPAQFGQFMKRLPAALVWGALPAPRMWSWARRGRLAPGDFAPDFSLRRQGSGDRVTLSSYRGTRPVVLVFGSYT